MVKNFVRCILLALFCGLTACTAAQKSAQSLSSSTPSNVKDGLIAAGIRAKLLTIDIDSAKAVRVSVNGGRVTLDGQARNEAQRREFEKAASSVAGVAGVVDRMSINARMENTRQTADDAALTARVAAALAAQTGVNVFSVKTTSSGGVVTLSGSVHSQAVKSAMLETARKVSDVRSVVDRLSVAQ